MLLKGLSMPCKLMRLSSVLPPACNLTWLGGREVVKPSNGNCEAEAMLAGSAEVVSRIQSWRTWQGLVLVTQLKILNNSIGLGSSLKILAVTLL